MLSCEWSDNVFYFCHSRRDDFVTHSDPALSTELSVRHRIAMSSSQGRLARACRACQLRKLGCDKAGQYISRPDSSPNHRAAQTDVYSVQECFHNGMQNSPLVEGLLKSTQCIYESDRRQPRRQIRFQGTLEPCLVRVGEARPLTFFR